MKKSTDFTINLMIPFMKYFGFWMVTGREKIFSGIIIFITYIQLIYLFSIVAYDAMFLSPDFSTQLYNMINAVSIFNSLFKLIAIHPSKRKFFNLILHLQHEFIDSEYTEHERRMLLACQRTAKIFIWSFTILVHVTVLGYAAIPFFENIGRNESDRLLVGNIWMSVIPFSPYYEIVYIIQIVCLIKIGVVYHSYDNFQCLMNLHVATQFRILHHRLESLESRYCSERFVQMSSNSHSNDSNYGADCYATFKTYIQQHKALLAYCKKLNEVFNIYALGQVILFTLILCLDAYQLLMADALPSKKMTFASHMLGCLAQLLMFTYSCDRLIEESLKVAEWAYGIPWTYFPMNKHGKMMRNDLLFLLVRSSEPCYISAYKFFPVSLQTYTTVISTGVSYFTLLKNSNDAET
ncbi:odorant receptor 10-like [Lasioglossum baleicum]|uniref:odorant receptor 10-like n=1 Tax=Lasioglossum baleicum TaxID=434251 RepID=UPI003FCC9744